MKFEINNRENLSFALIKIGDDLLRLNRATIFSYLADGEKQYEFYDKTQENIMKKIDTNETYFNLKDKNILKTNGIQFGEIINQLKFDIIKFYTKNYHEMVNMCNVNNNPVDAFNFITKAIKDLRNEHKLENSLKIEERLDKLFL